MYKLYDTVNLYVDNVDYSNEMKLMQWFFFHLRGPWSVNTPARPGRVIYQRLHILNLFSITCIGITHSFADTFMCMPVPEHRQM